MVSSLGLATVLQFDVALTRNVCSETIFEFVEMYISIYGFVKLNSNIDSKETQIVVHVI